MKVFITILVGLIGRLPASLRSRLGDVLGSLFALLPTKDRKIAALQLDLFLNQKANEVLRRVYGNLGQTLLESFNLTPLLKAEVLQIPEEDWSRARRMLDQGRGIVCLTAHCGNWELLAAAIVRRGVALSVIAREAHNAIFQSILRRIRDSYGVKTIWRANRQSIIEISDALARGEVVGALIDQDTRTSGQFVPFFGRLAKTPSTIIELAKRQNATIACAFCVRTGPGQYLGLIDEIASDLSTEEILSQYNQKLESILRKYPEQWPWMHKRWRSQPDGSHPRSAQYAELLQNLIQARSAL